MPILSPVNSIWKLFLRPYRMVFLMRFLLFFGISLVLVYLIGTGITKEMIYNQMSFTERGIVNNSKALHLFTNQHSTKDEKKENTIFMITPTYRRAEQIPELTRTGQTLLHVRNLVWIVVDETIKENDRVKDYLIGSGLNYVYLTAIMPKKYQKSKNKPRGVANRNKGLQWVRNSSENGVIYFGDDDNTYDLRIFEEIRSTNTVAMFPVGLVTTVGVSSPIVKDGVVVDFYDGWIANRIFPVDMAGFAVNVQMLRKNPKATMPYSVGYEEDKFLQALNIKKKDIEPKAENCTKIWVWHTQTKKNSPVSESKVLRKIKSLGLNSNLKELRKLVWRGN